MGYTSIMTDEEWRDVADYEGIYQVSNLGRVRTFRRKSGFVGFELSDEPRPMSLIPHGNGYLYVSLRKGDKRKNYYVHRLVARAFIGEIPDGYVVNHLDYNRSNNSADNLEIVTQRENVEHSKWKTQLPRRSRENYYICDRGHKYEVYVKLKYLGSFKTLDEARAARDEYISRINYY